MRWDVPISLEKEKIVPLVLFWVWMSLGLNHFPPAALGWSSQLFQSLAALYPRDRVQQAEEVVNGTFGWRSLAGNGFDRG